MKVLNYEMKDLNEPVLGPVFSKCILREGFPFTRDINPANVYDSILIKPADAECFSPRLPSFGYTIDEYVSFINKYELEKAVIVSDDISFLEKCPSLKYLIIIPSDSAGKDFDYSPLNKMTNLVYLDCHTEYGWNFEKTTTVDYSQQDGLISLDARGSGHLNINAIKTLKSLSVSYNKEENLHNLIDSKHLDTLKIVNCSIKNLSGIERSERLQCLELSYNRRLEDISGLTSVASTLKYLDIQNCGKIKDFSVIESLENLEVLFLYGSNSLPDLNFLMKTNKLRVFGFDINVSNGDLTPCLNLERACCARSRKHYNLNDKDLPKGDVSERIGFDGIEEWRQF